MIAKIASPMLDGKMKGLIRTVFLFITFFGLLFSPLFAETVDEYCRPEDAVSLGMSFCLLAKGTNLHHDML